MACNLSIYNIHVDYLSLCDHQVQDKKNTDLYSPFEHFVIFRTFFTKLDIYHHHRRNDKTNVHVRLYAFLLKDRGSYILTDDRATVYQS